MPTLSARHTPRTPALLLSMVVSAALLAACDREDKRTAGQKLDSAIAATDRKATEAAAEAREAGREAKQAVEAAGRSVKDVAITAEVKARLARDSTLNAMDINVDTTKGQVLLQGTAPDNGSRSRAAELARGVDGVVAVTNDLKVVAR